MARATVRRLAVAASPRRRTTTCDLSIFRNQSFASGRALDIADARGAEVSSSTTFRFSGFKASRSSASLGRSERSRRRAGWRARDCRRTITSPACARRRVERPGNDRDGATAEQYEATSTSRTTPAVAGRAEPVASQLRAASSSSERQQKASLYRHIRHRPVSRSIFRVGTVSDTA